MSTYSQAGVDIDAGDRAVELMKQHLANARRSEVVGDIGGFAGLFDMSAAKTMTRPLLATSTDGVGTKTEIARQLGKYDTIGEDLVAMVVDDDAVVVAAAAAERMMVVFRSLHFCFPPPPSLVHLVQERVRRLCSRLDLLLPCSFEAHLMCRVPHRRF